MMRIATFTLAVAALALAGCITWDTPYQPAGLRGGYSDEALGGDSYRVTFSGNGFSFGMEARDLALLRAAELCEDKGFGYLLVTASAFEEVPLTYYDATTYATHEVGTAPVATATFTCLAGYQTGARATGAIIAHAKHSYSENMPKRLTPVQAAE